MVSSSARWDAGRTSDDVIPGPRPLLEPHPLPVEVVGGNSLRSESVAVIEQDCVNGNETKNICTKIILSQQPMAKFHCSKYS